MQKYWLVTVVFLIILVAVFMNRPTSKESGIQSTEKQQSVSEEQKAEDDGSGSVAEITGEESEKAVASNENIVLMEPASDTLVSSPFMIRGKARGIPGNVLTVRIVNPDGTGAISETARVQGSDEKEFGAFEIKNLSYVFTSGQEKKLEVFASGENGAELYKLSIPLRFNLTK